MISYLSGVIIAKKEKFLIIDVNGVGFKVFLSRKSSSKIPEKGDNLKIFCHLHVRENALDLYGFLNFEELEFFEILNGISGVGPKIALEISSLGSLESMKNRILARDGKIFEGIPGVGKKRAMTIILELTGKINEFSKEKNGLPADEAEDGLIKLGFSQKSARDALSRISKNLGAEQRIKEALKNIQ